MNLGMTALFYGVVGLSVAVALWLSDTGPARGERWFRVATSVLFWPIYLPLLLNAKPFEFRKLNSSTSCADVPDELTAMIDRVERELDLALRSLQGWSDSALATEQVRIAELRSAWRSQADRLRELDALLAQPAFMESAILTHDHSAPERIARCEQSREQNLARLRFVRQRMYQDLISTLAWVRELVTMIHLAKYTGAPATRAVELVAQIAAAVEGLSEVSQWPSEEESPFDPRCLEPHASTRLESLPT